MDEAALREQLTEIIDNIATGIVVLNPDGRVVFANPEAAKIFGMARSAMIGKAYDTITSDTADSHDRPFPKEKRAFNRCLKTRAPVYGVEYRVKQPDGAFVFVSVNAAPISDQTGDIMAVVVSIINITAAKQAEASLSASEEQRFQTVADNAVDAIVTVDDDGKVNFWNRAAQKMFGYTSQEIVGRDIADLMPGELREKHKEGLRRFLAGGEPHIIGHTFECKGERRDGAVFPLEMALASWRSGASRHFTATVRDISERRRVEKEMSLLAAIVESSADAIISETLEGTILSWNPGAENIYGYTEKEIKGRSIAAILPPDCPGEVERLLNVVKNGTRVSHYRATHQRKDGVLISVCFVISPIKNKEGEVVAASMIAHHLKERGTAKAA